MTIRRLRNKNSNSVSHTSKNEINSSEKKRGQLRRHLLETLEARQLLALGPQLIGVQPNNSDLIENGIIRNVAPRELTFRFDDSQIIDAASVGGIRVTRAGSDGSFALPSISTDFGTNGRVDIQLTSRNAADLLTVNVTRSDLGPAADPTFAIAGNVVTINLNSNAAALVTAQRMIDLLNSSPVVSTRMVGKINGGLASAKIGGTDTASYSPLKLVSNNDIVVQPGAVVIGDSPNENEVTLRFAENLADDMYRLEVFGFDDVSRGITGLRNTNGDLFVPSNPNTRQDTIDFQLDLGSKITAVVPQPVVRLANGTLEQQRNTVVVYFDNDKLLVENGANGKPTARSVENPAFYQLIYTSDTVRNTDDLTFLPTVVTYNASANTATLRFDNDIDLLPGSFLPSATFRLRVGTNETAPMAPVRSEAAATAISDLNTNGAAKVRFVSKMLGEAGSGAQVVFVNSVASALPTVSVVGRVVTVDLGGATATVNQVVAALETDPASSALLKTILEPGSNGNAVIGNRPINYSPVTLYALGSTFDTASNLGTIGSASVPLTSLLLSSTIDPEVHALDLLGASDDLGQRIVAESMENHVNPAFGGDNFAGIRTIYYNFKAVYGTDSGLPVTNAITEKQKARIREAYNLWSNKLGVQFVETASSGLTMAFGTTDALSSSPGQVELNGQWGVRIDPTYQNSLAVFSANNVWNDNYGENLTRTAVASIGYMLGLSRAANLDPSEVMNLDSGFLGVPAGADRNFEPIFPGNQDIIAGQYLQRPEASDIDLYRFDIDFGANGQTREGEFVAETLAERSANSSPLDTRLALYKQVQATAVSNLGAGQDVQVQFTAVRSGKQGNNLQVFVTRSNRGVNALPIVNVFPNAVTIDLNSTTGNESTLSELITAIDNDPAARSIVKVSLLTGSLSTVIGNRDITYSPITLKGGDMMLISQNDNYFSKDSLIRMSLSSGVYFVGVSASGNDQYDPTVADSGTGGRTQGKYDLRLTFRAQTDSSDSIQDVSTVGGDTSLALDGDADGKPGGVYNFWFETAPLDRTLRFNAGGSADLEGKIITIRGGNGVERRFEFSLDTSIGIGNTRIAYTLQSSAGELANALANAISSRTELGVTATSNGARVTLRGERFVQLSQGLIVVDIAGKTIFVDKSAGPNADGSLAHPFNSIAGSGVANAFGSTSQGDIVRIVGNGGNDGKLETVNDNVPYEIGFGLLAGSILADGASMDVPNGVTVMIDAGAVFKLRRAQIGVGSSSLGVDRSGGALQVFGAPVLLDSNGNPARLSNGTVASGSVFFTSWLDESLGLDGYTPSTTPAAGDWGGLQFKRDLDSAAGRFDLEDEGIFRQYVNHADIRYGGSSAVVIDSVQQTVNAIQIADMRPTVSFNKISFSADSAISATPDSFQETLFSEPEYQRKGSFTPDYDRVGPEIHDNLLVNNSINGMFIKVSTPAGGDLKQLTVAGRFDDIDITHVIAENIFIQGNPGGGILDQSVLPSNLISFRGRTGGTLLQGTYNYKLTYVDKNGYETPPSSATQNVTLSPGQTAISLTGLPGVNGEFVNRRLYRSSASGSGPYRLVAELDGGSFSFEDLGYVLTDVTDDQATLLRDSPDVRGVLSQPSAGGTLVAGNYTYRLVMVDSLGNESLASAPTAVVTTNALNRSVLLTNLPTLQPGYATRRIYRSSNTGSGTYQLIGEITDGASTSLLDTGANLVGTLSVATLGNVRPRLDASLAIDPGTVVKLEGARIEVGHSAQLMAEGVDGGRIVFTSKQDDRFGIGGTFDTNNNGLHASADAQPRDWSGIYAFPGSTLLLDHSVVAFAGGSSRIEGTFKSFSPIELQQANARIANSTFENNANGIGGQGPIDRLGRPANENYPLGNNASRGSTLFIRGSQPTLLDNVFQNNAGSAMTIDANSMDAVLRGDLGRQSGLLDRSTAFDANRGPLIRENRMYNNGLNGLEIRGDYSTNNRDETVLAVRDLQRNILTTESVWDDTDIVHVLFDSITVSNLEHSGGLRLQSAINESLVVKLDGQGSNFDKERGTGFTATGEFNGVSDRVGGTVQVLGQPGFPVVLTSLRDDTVGAGTRPDGSPQTDTNNDGVATVPRPGDWRSLLFDTFSNDRNVTTVLEVEPTDTVAPGSNDFVLTAQLLGTVAANESSSDENLPLGYVVHGVLSEPNDQDVFSFVGTAGTEVWFDVDNTTYSLDTVIEILNANGDLLARSDNSTDEQSGVATIYTTSLMDPNNANPLVRRVTASTRKNVSGLVKDDYTSNPKDAGLRVLLPGISGSQSTYFFRVRSHSTNIDNSAAGLTSGSYDVQVRIRDKQEFSGSIVSQADIRFATNGVQASGLPYHSPLTGEANYNMFDGTPNDGITQLGNLNKTDKGAISVAGRLAGPGSTNQFEFIVGETDLISANPGTLYPIVIDVDYADGLNRPDTSAFLTGPGGQFFSGNSTTAVDDLPGPLGGSDLSDLSRGSVGSNDAYIGTIYVPAGTYQLTIGSQSGVGEYQVEIRKGDPLSKTQVRNYRGSNSTSLFFSNGLVIPDHSIMELSDGANRVAFEFTYDGSFAFGNSPVVISSTMTAPELAVAVRDAINQVYLQNRFRIRAANSNRIDTGSAGNNTTLNLFGNVDIVRGSNLLGPTGVEYYDGIGDVNVTREQGQFVVTSSTITDSRDYAVWSGPADLYYADGRAAQPLYRNPAFFTPNYVIPPTLGGAYARNLPVLNTVPFAVGAGTAAERAGLAPGMVVANNVFDSSGLGGLHVEGENPYWRITAFPGALDSSQTDNAEGDHSGGFINDGHTLQIDYGRQRVTFEFEDIAGGTTGAPTLGSGVMGGNGWGADNIPIYYREDTGADYLRPPATPSGYAADEVVKAIRDSIMGSVLVTNGTTQNMRSWVEPQTGGGLGLPTASIVLQGPQNIQYFGGNPLQIQRLGEYTAAPYLRAVNNTVIGNDGRASFNATAVDTATNDTLAGAAETWQGTGNTAASYVVNGTLTADPLSVGSSDVDLYKFTLEVGERVLIDVDTLPGATLDSVLKIFDSRGRAQIVANGNDPLTNDDQAAPGESGASADPYIEFTATSAGVYYAAISASGNSTYDPLSLADRLQGGSSGTYTLSMKVLKPQNFVITVDDPSTYADGETFTIDQVADFFGTNNRTATFEFTRSGAVQAGNIPVYIGAEYRVPDVARSIASAINAAGLMNTQFLPNGTFGLASPLAPVSAVALGGINGHSPTIDISAGHGDVGINSGNSRGAEVEAGLNRYRGPGDRGANDDQSPFDNGGRGHFYRGIGHNRTMSGAFGTALGNGTTEKYVVVRNASSMFSRGNIKIDNDFGANTNLNQIIPESGIYVSGGASPSLLNNVFVNVQTPIVRENTAGGATTRPSAVIVGGSTYQYVETRQALAYLGLPVEASPTNIPNTALDFNFVAGDTEQLFVDMAGGNFLPNPTSRLIDSSLDSMAEREKLRAVKGAVGILPSPILAPNRDLTGQLRSDDPNVAPPSGLGANVFKDRGAIDRADFVGPTAITLTPIDNDAQSVDIDTTVSVMRLTSGVYPEFRIQLKDGFETSNLQAGTGINDDSVVGRDSGNRLAGAVVTITENGRLLLEGIDYAFSYNTTTNEIILKPLAGVWKREKVYDITLNNKDRFVVDAPAGDETADGNTFTVRDSNGGNVTFEYDSGYRLQIPQGVELIVPLAGGGAGGVNDGDRFVINNGTANFTFEFDNNNNSIAGTIRIPFTSLSTRKEVADAIVAAMSAVPNISPRVLSSENVFVGALLGAYAETSNAPALSQPKSTFALLAPALGTRPGGVVDGQTFGVSDGRQNTVFEFDSDRSVQPGNISIDISNASTAADVAQVIKARLDSSGLALTTQIVDGDKVYLGLPNAGRVDTVNSAIKTVGVSRSLGDGQSVSITRTVGSVVTTKVFELDTNGSVASGSIMVSIVVSDTQADIGQKLALAIRNSGLGLEPEHVGDGNIFIGGTSEYEISVANAPSIGLFGRPGVQSNTTLDIFGTLLLQLPARGGVDLTDNSRFTITNNLQAVTFEFDGNFSGPTAAGNISIPFTQSSTAADLVTTMLPLIAGTSLGIVPRDAGGGRIDLGLLPNSAVNPLSSAVTTARGSVSDADYFTIDNGIASVTFEFENLSIGNGRTQGRVPIRYNNQSSRADVFAAMKAAIESSFTGLSTVIQADGLKLLDNARYITNVDNAPSLRMTGVPGGAIAISFVQDQSFDSIEMRDSIIRSINDANANGKTSLQAKVRGGSTFFIENAVNVSPDMTSYYLRGIEDVAGNFLKSNRINNETQFTILMPGVQLDFGDAPDPVTTTPGRYPSLLSQDGARHVSNASELHLGTQISSELDGKPTPNADGDTSDDGVKFKFQGLDKPLFNRNVDTLVTVTLSQPGIVDGWIDFNADGDWTDPSENVLNGAIFTATTLTQTFAIRLPVTAPVPAVSTNTFARFRTSTAGQTLPTGLALDGEVEDYLVRVVPGVPPIGNADTYTMNEDQVGGLVTTDATGALTPGFVVDDGVLANDSSPDGRQLLSRIVTPPQHVLANSFVFNSNGTFSYQPTPDYFGLDSFVYLTYVNLDTTQSEILESIAYTTVTIDIRPVNDAPTAKDFDRATDEDVALNLTERDIIILGDGFAGAVNEAGQTLRVSLPNSVSSQGGTVTVAGGVVIYTPKADFSGLDSFAYTLTDDGTTGSLPDPQSVTRTITVTVRDKNDAPITTSKAFSVGEDGVDVRGPAFFINGDTPGPDAEILAGQTVSFSGVVQQSEKGGTVSYVNGQITYRPAPDFNGVDRFYYLISDNGTSQGVSDPQTTRGTVTVTVNAVDDVPRVVNSFATVTMVEDEAERALPIANYFFDPDVIPNDDKLTYSVVRNSNTSLVEPTFGATDVFLRPKADQNGNAVIVFAATDKAGHSVENTLTLVVTPVNDAPRLVAPLPNLSIAEDTVVGDITLTPTYFDDPDVLLNGDTLTFSVTNSNADVVTASIVNGKLRLVLVTDASGVATITVRTVDSTGNALEDSFDITVSPVNDAPRVSDDLTYLAQQGVTFRTTDARGTLTTSKNDDGVLANDRDIEGNTFTARLTQAPTLGTVSLNADGTFSYTPHTTTLSGAVDSFQYEAVDSLGAVSSQAVVKLTITNPPPPRHQNPSEHLDVDADGFISPIDVLIIVNFLNFNGSSVSVAGLPDPPPYRDVNGNNFIEPLDVLTVINFINARKNSGAGEGEGQIVTGTMASLSSATPLTWSSDVTRDSSNVGTTMLPSGNIGRIANAAQPAPVLSESSREVSLADYLASFGDETNEASESIDEIASNLTSASDNESLDSFFADVFGQ